MIPQILHGLYLLSYRDIPRLTAPQLFDKSSLEGIRNSAARALSILTDKEKLNNAFTEFRGTDVYFLQKRAWCALRDYIKHRNYNSYLTKALRRIDSTSGLLKLLEMNTESVERQEALTHLELPGHVWNNNPKFIRCVSGNGAAHGSFPRNLRELHRLSNISTGYPEQFDFTFRFVPNMCEKENCEICPFAASRRWHDEYTSFEKVCPTVAGSYCPVMLMAGNYRHECPGQEKCELHAIVRGNGGEKYK